MYAAYIHARTMGTHTQTYEFMHDHPLDVTVAAGGSFKSCFTWSHRTKNVERENAAKVHHFKTRLRDAVCSCSLMKFKGSQSASRKLVVLRVAILLCWSHYAVAVSYADLCKHASTLIFQCDALHDSNIFLFIKKKSWPVTNTKPREPNCICFI